MADMTEEKHFDEMIVKTFSGHHNPSCDATANCRAPAAADANSGTARIHPH